MTNNEKCGSIIFVINAWLAQLVEQRTENPRVSGSIPEPGTFYMQRAGTLTSHNHSYKKSVSALYLSGAFVKGVKYLDWRELLVVNP